MNGPAAWGVLALRIHLGLTMAILAGLGKVAAFPAAPWFVEQVAGIGFPAPGAFAFVAAWGEVLGGLLLAAGLFTRLAAAQLCVQMGVAAFLYHGVFPVVDLHITHTLFWTFGCLTLLGAGRFGLDTVLHERTRCGGGKPPLKGERTSDRTAAAV
jgi:putative oxidoreductase